MAVDRIEVLKIIKAVEDHPSEELVRRLKALERRPYEPSVEELLRSRLRTWYDNAPMPLRPIDAKLVDAVVEDSILVSSRRIDPRINLGVQRALRNGSRLAGRIVQLYEVLKPVGTPPS